MCNVFGVERCSLNECICKPAYFGARCEFCISKSYVLNVESSSGKNGTVKRNGYGVSCRGLSNKTISKYSCFVILYFSLACENPSGETCNILGTNEGCGPSNKESCGFGSLSFCIPGYKGKRCELCTDGYYPSEGVYGIVDPTTNKGVKCSCK